MRTRASLSALALASALLATTSAVAQSTGPSATPSPSLRRSDAMLMLDYQSVRVPGDAPIDLMGFHLHNRVAEGVYLGAGVLAPLVKGEYGGFMAFDIGAHLERRLWGPLFATAGLAAGGGGGGRSIVQSKVLSGTGGFARAYAGLGYDFGAFALGATASKVKFRASIIDSTQANVFVRIPYSYLAGPFASHGQPLPPGDSRLAAEGIGENMLTLTLDNFRQIRPQGTNKETIRTADLQFSHFFAPDTYWFGALGVGYRGLPIYNQVLGGVGQRVRLSPRFTAYGQLGIGSGGYAPEEIDTDAGLLVYPKVSLEVALTRNLGLALSVGHLSAPKGSSRNQTYGLALTQHLRSAGDAGGVGAAPSYQGYRVGLFHQTDFDLRYRDIERKPLQMIGVQVDTLLDQRWYIPLQAAVAYNAYLGYPGYGEMLAGLGLQTRAEAGDRLQWFGQVMGGANVHGTAAKASGGLRVILDERLSLSVNAGRIEARNSGGARFVANTVGLGLDYRFAIPTR